MLRIVKLAGLLAAMTAITLFLAGCTGGGPSFDGAKEAAAVKAVIAGFEQGIEDYSMEGMTGCLTSGFVLTLVEGGRSYDKSYGTLLAELEADEDNQLRWRHDYGYKLDLQLNNLTVSVASATSARAFARFGVEERADGTTPKIDPRITDSGTIEWQFAKVGGNWKVTAMTITFDPHHALKAAGVRSAVPGELPGNPFFRRPS